MGCEVWRHPELSRIRSKKGNQYPKAVSKTYICLKWHIKLDALWRLVKFWA
jgi:hypothetical protein